MARRLSEDQKKSLVQSFRSGETAATLARSFDCSPNTVTRIVRAFLSEEEYAALKTTRSRKLFQSESRDVEISSEANKETFQVAFGQSEVGNELPLLSVPNGGGEKADSQGLERLIEFAPIALDDADDFGEALVQHPLEQSDPLVGSESDLPVETFQELVPLTEELVFGERPEIHCEPLSEGTLPGSVYMLVDKSVELDSRPLKDFPELGFLGESEKELQALYLFSSPRAAKRQCGRSQRVIKVPDTKVFELSASYLIARGITRLVIEGNLIALDS